MEVAEVRDAVSLRAWLIDLPQKTEAERTAAENWAHAIGQRAMLRAVPFVFRMQVHVTKFPQEVSTAPIHVLRMAIHLSRDLDYPNKRPAPLKDYRRIRDHVHGLDNYLLEEIAGDYLDQNRNAQGYVFEKCSSAMHTVLDLYEAEVWSFETHSALAVKIAEVVEVAAKLDHDIWQANANDVNLLLSGSELAYNPLWSFDSSLIHTWAEARLEILAQGDGWRFWVEWYEKALHGRPQDYDLLTKIALIDPKDWDKGADHVNALIQQIIEQDRLTGEARALKEEIGRLKAELQSLQHRSHNNPPELVDEAVAAQKSVTIIWAALDEAEKELEKPKPDPDRLAGIGRILFDAIKAVGGYCASLADSAIRESVKMVATGTTALLLAAHNERLLAFVEALGQFARSLGK